MTSTTARRTGVMLIGSYEAFSTSTGVCISRWLASDIGISNLHQSVLLPLATGIVNRRFMVWRRRDVRELRRGASQRQYHHLLRARALDGSRAGRSRPAGCHHVVYQHDDAVPQAFGMPDLENAADVFLPARKAQPGLRQGRLGAKKAACLDPHPALPNCAASFTRPSAPPAIQAAGDALGQQLSLIEASF